ncbi:MAG TPA: helix-turn-helix transcriptional regulator [Candidatus Eisenbacteria bacterium]|nr:helix-turn-helix transcriptional regulator [Candidatus Eisenbacteria bacterium]
MDNFGEYVKELRKRNRLTLKQAEALGVASNAYLSQLEREHRKRPHPDILRRMSEVYKEPLKNLMVAAGYLTPETENKSLEERIEHAYREVQNDPLVSHGTRRRGPKLSLDAQRFIVEMYENLTGRKLL